MFEDRARRADSRRGVGVLVSVDTDDDTKIPMESQHAVRSLAKRKDIDPRPERRCGKTVMSHTRKGGQASDQANARQPGPAPEQGRTSPIEGTIRGPISFWVTSLPPAPVSDAASQNRRNPDSQSVLTGTTSHQHYRSPHQPPGHDLVIDLKGPGKIRVLTGSGLGQQNASTRRCCSPIRPDTTASQSASPRIHRQ